MHEAIRTRFGPTLEGAARCEVFAWRATPSTFTHDALVQELVTY